MNNDNKTTRQKALNWFGDKMTYAERNNKANQYFPSIGRSLDENEIEQLYLSEHPLQPEQTIKEETEVEFTSELLRLRTFEELASDSINELEKENKELKEQNKLLKQALRKMYITFNTHDNAEDWLILEEVKELLNQ